MSVFAAESREEERIFWGFAEFGLARVGNEWWIEKDPGII